MSVSSRLDNKDCSLIACFILRNAADRLCTPLSSVHRCFSRADAAAAADWCENEFYRMFSNESINSCGKRRKIMLSTNVILR